MAQSTTGAQHNWTTNKLVTTALFCAAAAVCTMVIEFPLLLPPMNFLKYDPSGIIAVLAGLIYGPGVGVIVSILPYTLHIATQSGLYGVIMAVLSTLTYVLPAALIVRTSRNPKRIWLGLTVGSIISIVACVLGNLVITPLYLGMPVEAVIGLLWAGIIPFNVLKVLINSVVCALIVKRVRKALGED